VGTLGWAEGGGDVSMTSMATKATFFCPDYTNLGGIWPPETLSHMHPNFNREGRVAGYWGQCPKFDRILFLMASLTVCIKILTIFQS
jgi:hypothetical protein